MQPSSKTNCIEPAIAMPKTTDDTAHSALERLSKSSCAYARDATPKKPVARSHIARFIMTSLVL